jgi:hypothetical protein
MLTVKGRKGFPILRFLPVGKPLICQISLRVHVRGRGEQEYHSRAYAIRIIGETTELLVADKNRKLLWINTEYLEVVEA